MPSIRANDLRALLPLEVAVSTQVSPAAAEPLFPCEEACVHHAVPARKREFAVGRTCARRALRHLGVATAAIAVGEMRAPIWPAGIVGSITHCPSFCAAAVARSVCFRAVGIDAVLNLPLGREVRNLVVGTEEERAWAEKGDPLVHWDVALFSVKEAVFKAWWPLRRRWLEFDDIHVSLDPAAGAFRAQIQTADTGRWHSVDGRFAVSGELILSAAVIPSSLPDDRPVAVGDP